MCQREEANAIQQKSSPACLNNPPGKLHAAPINDSNKIVTLDIKFTVGEHVYLCTPLTGVWEYNEDRWPTCTLTRLYDCAVALIHLEEAG